MHLKGRGLLHTMPAHVLNEIRKSLFKKNLKKAVTFFASRPLFTAFCLRDFFDNCVALSYTPKRKFVRPVSQN